MPRKRKDEVLPPAMTQEDLDEGLALLHGNPIMAYEPPAPVLVEAEDGTLHTAQGAGFVKFSYGFRKTMLRELKGAKLAVFMCICLHVNERGESWPGVATIAEETGYYDETVMDVIKELEAIPGLLGVTRSKGHHNVYRPSFVAYGRGKKPVDVNQSGKPRPVGVSTGGVVVKTPTTQSGKPRHEEEPVGRTIEVEPREGVPAAPVPGPGKAPSKATGKKAPDPRSQSPQVQAFRAVTGSYPPVVLYDPIIAAIGDLTAEQLLPYYQAWVAKAFNPNNKAWVLDWAAKRCIPGQPQNGRANGHGQKAGQGNAYPPGGNGKGGPGPSSGAGRGGTETEADLIARQLSGG